MGRSFLLASCGMLMVLGAAQVSYARTSQSEVDAERREAETIMKYIDIDENIMMEYKWPPKIEKKWKRAVKGKEVDTLEGAIDALNTDDMQLLEKATYKFEMLGKKAVPSLVGVMKKQGYSDRVYINALYIAGRLGDNARGAVPVVTQFLYHDDADYQAISALALGKIGESAERSVPHLRRLLYHNDSWVRYSAESALLDIGSKNALRAVKEYQIGQIAPQAGGNRKRIRYK